MDRRFHLSFAEQKLRYDYHENSIENDGYVKFLKKCIEPALPFIYEIESKEPILGLDYGSGPDPTLSKILENYKLKVDNYDPIYINKFPNQKFDFIFSTEVWEHFHIPAEEIAKIKSLLKPNAILAIMTSTWNEDIDFTSWHYPKDETHVSFYHEKTFLILEELFGFKNITHFGDSVWIFKNLG